METLRLEQSEFLYRRVAKPFEVDGYTVPAGWILRLCVNEAHRDPAVFEDPDRFDPGLRDRAWSRNEYSPFGGHTHGCMGAHLAHFLGPHLRRGARDQVRPGPSCATDRSNAAAATAITGGRARSASVVMRPRDDAPQPPAPVEAIGAA
ncbi:MAG: cytochrome P450 [Betaproteobacteria bacterium]|nr:cytochrome P450 [Betaproteobacteria bacterium]